MSRKASDLARALVTAMDLSATTKTGYTDMTGKLATWKTKKGELLPLTNTKTVATEIATKVDKLVTD